MNLRSAQSAVKSLKRALRSGGSSLGYGGTQTCQRGEIDFLRLSLVENTAEKPSLEIQEMSACDILL